MQKSSWQRFLGRSSKLALALAGAVVVLAAVAFPPEEASANYNKKLGQACNANSDCDSNRCDRGMNTSNTGKCIPNDGTGHENDYCTHDNHCQSGACYKKKCIKKQGLGGSCEHDQHCYSSYVCENGPWPSLYVMIVGPVCIPKAGQGNIGNFCTADNQCKSNLCATTSQTKGGAYVARCSNKRNALGEHCYRSSECVSNRCDEGLPAAQRTCIPNDGTGKSGEHCTHDNHCISKACIGHICAGLGQLGKSCNKVPCVSNLVCDNQKKTCVRKAGEGKLGEYCNNNNQCESKICTGSKCGATKVDIGSSCTSNDSCLSGRCDVGMGTSNSKKCIPNDGHGKNGQYCTHDNHCGSGYCMNRTCTARKALGVTCEKNNACVSRRCDTAPGNPRKCIPNDGTGNKGDYCTHNNQCKNHNCPVPGPGKSSTCH